MFNRFNQDTYQLVPALCVQESQIQSKNINLVSQLQSEREIIHEGKKKTILYRLRSLNYKPKKIYKKNYKKLFKNRYIVPFK